jgi:hypothetical protein
MRLFFNPLDMIKHFTYFDFFPYAVFRKDQEEIGSIPKFKLNILLNYASGKEVYYPLGRVGS